MIARFISILAATCISSCSFTSGDLLDTTKKPVRWEKISENNSPDTPLPARRGAGFVYCGDDRALLFGGYNTAYLNDTWEYNIKSNTWTNVSPSTSPPAREKAAMVYITNGKIILFGGQGQSATDLNDTWQYDISNNTWTQLIPLGDIPSARSSHTMAYTDNGKIIMAGGTTGSAELWKFDTENASWSLLTPNSNGKVFVGRYGHGMSYAKNGEVYIFGGYNNTELLNDTWINNSNYDYIWFKTVKAGAPGTPSARRNIEIIYTENNYLVMFGGYNGSYLNDTWYFDMGMAKWNQVKTINKPHSRSLYSMIYTGKNEVLLFGGYYNDGTDNYMNDIWKFYSGPGEY